MIKVRVIMLAFLVVQALGCQNKASHQINTALTLDSSDLHAARNPPALVKGESQNEWPTMCHDQMMEGVLEELAKDPNSWFGGPSAEAWNSMEDKTKLYYCLRERESFGQGCAAYPGDFGDYGLIYFEASNSIDALIKSARQSQFLRQNREMAITEIRWCVNLSGVVDNNTKRIIIYLRAKELFPDLVTLYLKDEARDLGILTVLVKIMSMHEFAPLLEAEFYQMGLKEKGNRLAEEGTPDFLDRPFVDYSQAIEQEIIKLATAFNEA